ncbi:MAG: hypothetical protein ACLQU4_10950 [Limisphaerales bacterium]
MNSEFENHLQRQPMRDVPPQWRSRIMASAQPKPARWREWLWPCPQAWATLGAAWVVIVILHFTAPDEPRLAGNSQPLTSQSFAILQQQTVIMAQLLGPSDADDQSAPLPVAPTPRSERERRQLFG